MATKKAKIVNEQKVVILLEQAIPEIEGRNAWEIPESHLEKDGKGGYKVVSKPPCNPVLPTRHLRLNFAANYNKWQNVTVNQRNEI